MKQWRRRVQWTQNTDGIDEYHYFEITGEYKGDSWQWHSKVSTQISNFSGEPSWSSPSCSYIVNTKNPMKIVDYCREVGLDIENEHRNI